MTITFYTTTDDPKVVHKTLTQNISVTGHFKDDANVENPVVLVNPSAEILTSNYAYIDMLNRYYFIEQSTIKKLGNILEIPMSEDVLYTNRDGIANLVGTIDRNEYERNGYLLDSNYKAYAYQQIVAKAFPNKLDDDSIILITVG